MMWLPPAILGVAVVAYPLLTAPRKAVLVFAVAALAVCAFGIVVRATSVVVAAGGLALVEYTLALWLAGGRLDLGGAALVGVGLLLLVETADFERRTRGATLGPGLAASQIRSWAASGALGGAVAFVLVVLATATSGMVAMPWSPAFAAIGATVALVAITVALRRSLRGPSRRHTPL